LVGTEQEHHRLLLKAEARERKNKMKDSLLPLGAMKALDISLDIWKENRGVFWIYFNHHVILSFIPLLPKPSHFTFHVALQVHMSAKIRQRPLESFKP
jgi:hypothetical protein